MALNKTVTILLLAIASTSWIQAVPMLSAGEGYKLLWSIHPDGSNDVNDDYLAKNMQLPLDDGSKQLLILAGIASNLDDLIAKESTEPRNTTELALWYESVAYMTLASERIQKGIKKSKVLTNKEKARFYVLLISNLAMYAKWVAEVTQNPSPSSKV